MTEIREGGNVCSAWLMRREGRAPAAEVLGDAGLWLRVAESFAGLARGRFAHPVGRCGLQLCKPKVPFGLKAAEGCPQLQVLLVPFGGEEFSSNHL